MAAELQLERRRKTAVTEIEERSPRQEHGFNWCRQRAGVDAK
jgi:hypothetical protein